MKLNFISRIAKSFPSLFAAGKLADVPLPKPPSGQVTIPGFRPQEERSANLLRKTTRVNANTDATSFRTGSSTSEVIRNFAAANPDMSSTINAYLRTGIPKSYRITAHDLDGRINPEATKAAHEILTRITFLGDPNQGYNPTSDLQSISESLGKELLFEGAMALELVLDDMGMPTAPVPIAVSTLQFREDSKRGIYPVQVVAGKEIDLDFPTIFYVSVDQDLLTAYAEGYLVTALRAVLADEDFNNFLIRQLRRNIAPRMIVTIIEENLKKSMAIGTLNNPEKMKEVLENTMAGISETIENLEPEDSIITTDAVGYKLAAPGENAGGAGGVGAMLKAIHEQLQSRLTAALKTLPAVLGRDSGQGSATVSAYLFLKSAEVLALKLGVIYSRMLTVAVRLLGMNCYVDFKYDDVDLRPKGEQEAYRAMEQDRILEQLSLGFITDEQACVALTGKLPPDGYQPKSGTMFKTTSRQVPNTTSQTSLMNGQKDSLKSDAPTGKKS